jgi:hypothetical protein
MFLTRSVYFLSPPPPAVSRVLRESTHAVQVDFILLNNRQYLPGVAWRYWIKSCKTLFKVDCLGTQNPGHLESHAPTHCASTISVSDYYHHIINIIGIAEYKTHSLESKVRTHAWTHTRHRYTYIRARPWRHGMGWRFCVVISWCCFKRGV